jgi:hypothetical protein
MKGRLAGMSDSSAVRATTDANETTVSAVSWSAIFAGAVATAALSLALIALGTGIGFSASPPWVSPGVVVTRVGRTAIIWIFLTQVVASSVGGFMAGRLRTRWVRLHTHEVFFRDTAHGFLAWSTSVVLTAGLLTSAASMMAGAGLPSSYPNASLAAERVYASSTESGERDSRASIAAQIEDRRKAIAHSLYWTFAAMLMGAFCASFAATIGGKERDRMAIA